MTRVFHSILFAIFITWSVWGQNAPSATDVPGSQPGFILSVRFPLAIGPCPPVTMRTRVSVLSHKSIPAMSRIFTSWA